MKILHIIPSISSKRGGPSKAVFDMVKALRSEGVDASILSTNDNSLYREEEFIVNEWFLHLDVPVLLLPCHDSKFRVIREFLFSSSLTYWLLRYIQNYDLIHVHALFSYPSTIAMLIARVHRKPYIIRTIGQLSRWSLSQSKFRKKLMLHLIERSNLSNAVAVHVTSKSEQEDVLRLNLGCPTLLLGLGVDFNEDCDKVIKKPPEDCIKFLFLSRLHPKKRLEVLITALAYMQSYYNHSNWYLYIAGDGEQDYVLKLKTLANKLGISNRIAWMGHITGHTKEDLLRSVDWYVLPSASENFAISAVEAMAAGVPVIITNSVGVADMVQEHGAGIIIGDNTNELSQALHQAMTGPPVAMKQASRRLVKQHYLWSNVARQLSAFYSRVLH
ncbi:MAG: hypothetical protein RLZZ609_1330 [Cyanobacteriota bacterium]|jgi:glycosyltransferase involved in cell wall biosynthesis